MTMCERDVLNLLLSLYISDGKTKVKVIAGKSLGTKAVIDTHSPIMFLDIHVTAGGSFEQNVPKEYNAFAYVWRGAGSFTADKISVDMGKVNCWIDFVLTASVLLKANDSIIVAMGNT